MLSSLKLQNFLAFRELSLELRPLTVLAGTNSAGKTSLLHALALLRQSKTAGTLPAALLLNGELVQLGTGRDVLHREPGHVAGLGRFGLAFRVSAGSQHTNYQATYDPAADVLPIANRRVERTLGGLFKPGFQYLTADRVAPAVVYPKSHEAVAVKHFLGADGRYTANYLLVHSDMPLSQVAVLHKDSPTRRLADQTRAWVNALSPGTSIATEDVTGTDFVRLGFVQAGHEVRTESLRATNVGFGLTYSLPIIVACLAAKTGGLLLIENPEAHLHPRAQALLGRLCALCAAGGTQVILETHSDHVLNAVRLAIKDGDLLARQVALHFFTREPDVLQPCVETLDVQPDGMISRWPPGFFDEWDRAVDRLLG
ncbi:MAG TPA: DUF3696 domain-containing protein [Solirubrobacteraceae bacterium]|nr:DUF3696 domain-containing protein [Solirubrobacteraceae bacterium]